MNTKILFLTEGPKSGQSVMQIETPEGEVLNLVFSSTLPLHQKDWYTQVIQASVDKYYAEKKDKGVDFFSYIMRNLYRNQCVGIFYIMPERNIERERLGARIKEMREEQFMDSKELAQRVGIDPANMCRIEQGRYSAGLDILCKIAHALNAELDFVRPYPVRPEIHCGSVEDDFEKIKRIAEQKAEKVKDIIQLKDGETKEIPFWTEDFPELICVGKFKKVGNTVSFELDYSQTTL